MVVHGGGTIKKGRLIDVTRCRVAGSDVLVARAANLHQATEDNVKKGRLINVTRCVGGSDVSVARAANHHQATED